MRRFACFFLLGFSISTAVRFVVTGSPWIALAVAMGITLPTALMLSLLLPERSK